MITARGGVVACAGAIVVLLGPFAAGVIASTPADAGEHAFARARFAWAARDTFAAVRALEETLASPGTPRLQARAELLLRLLDDRPLASADSDQEALRAWSAVLGGDAASSIDDPAVRLILAARALDAGDVEAAGTWLAGSAVPDAWRALHLHLRARAALLRGDEHDADRVLDELVERRVQRDPQSLREQAWILAATRALHEDVEIAATEPPDSPRAALLAILLDARSAEPRVIEARLQAWLQEHSGHPAADFARAERIALALDRHEHAQARELALERRAALALRRDELHRALADSTTTALELWSRPAPNAAALDVERWNTTIAELVEHLFDAEGRWPGVDDAVGLVPADARASEPGDVILHREDRIRDAALGDSLDVARRTVARADENLRSIREEIAARLHYHERGARSLESIDATLRATLDELGSLRVRGPALLADLRAVEDTLLARIERRTRLLATRADEQARDAAGMTWLYAEGPMARRDPAPREGVPTPGALLRGEARLARATASALDSLRDASRELVRRSFSDVFTRRVTDGLGAAIARAEQLLARGSALASDLRGTMRSIAGDPRLAAAEDHLRSAERELADLRIRRHEHRVLAAARAVDDAIARIEAEAEGVTYSLAVATTALAIEGGDAAARDLRSEARSLWAQWLASDPDPRVRGDARYRWADLELVNARDEFQRRMGEWLGAEESDRRALAPLLDIEPALALFRAILDEDPTFAHRDLVLFQLGMLHADRGEAEAETYLARLIEEFPGSEWLQEAHLRRGELAFDEGAYVRAIDHLRAAAAGDDPEVRAIALYKLGWSAHTVGDLVSAIDAFLRLTDLFADPATAPRRVDLAQEARALLLRSLARDGGADAFARTFDAAGERAYAPALLGELSALLAGYALLEAAEQADRMFLERYPHDAGALVAAERWVRGAEERKGPAAGDAARLQVYEHFLAANTWASAHRDSVLRARGDEFARQCLVTVAVRGHQRARETENPVEFDRARALYERLLAIWPAHEEAVRWNLLAGECARATGAYEVALARFEHAAAATSPLAAEAAWQRVATAELWYRSSASSDPTSADPTLARRLLAIGDAYVSEDSTRVRDLHWRLLQVALAHGWDEDVVARSAAFAHDHPRDERVVTALRLHAEAHYRDRSYDRAAKAFENAVAHAGHAGADSLARAMRPWIAHSEDLHAQSLASDPEHGPLAAARAWHALATRWPDSEPAERALYRAGEAFERSGAATDAAQAWTALLANHPDGEFAADTHRNLARLHEERGDLALAASAIERFAREHPTAEDAGPALLHAATLLERAQDAVGRARVLDLYLAQHPEDLDTHQAVLEERALVELEREVDGEHVRALQDFAERTGRTASVDLRARVGMLRADRLVTKYQDIALTQPLNVSLERKRQALTAVLEAYREVAELGVRPHAQAAAHSIGAALVHMADALRASERPGGLQGDDLVAYDEVIEGQAFEFSERGESAWRELLVHHRLGDDARVDAWIVRTRAALFPRTAQRFLHHPSFEYPVLGAEAPSR